ncbi:heparan-alpha-glucosaminide N-acetyltransferase [Chelativorans sp.]|uniref:heparan-alpha-glucosaminide N-acetyltransferase n=1 Tax=Chelativorans sp. TaxID=2203393 RepID=UPI002810CE44|nr:heparan-alpha-glucosaminide N-acetyltransferase [Chelativorans sp.]
MPFVLRNGVRARKLAQGDMVQPERSRIELVDIARGVALVAMAIYHFTWDLDFFGYIEPGTSVTGGWRIFARCIASSFLFLVGVSLYLAHGGGFRRRSFLRRLAMIAGAAAAITLVTYILFPDSFIFFGILHHIAVATVLGAAALRLPVAALLVLAAAVIAAPHFVQAQFLDHPVFWWTGFSRNVPSTNDFIPIFPWFGAVLLGIAAAKAADRAGLFARLRRIRLDDKLPLLGAAGRHSLAFYLLHQPVLISGLWLFAQVVPPPPPDPGARFLQACIAQCMPHRDEGFCRAYCGCVLDEATAQGRVGDLFATGGSRDAQSWVDNLAIQCSVENNG